MNYDKLYYIASAVVAVSPIICYVGNEYYTTNKFKYILKTK